MLTPTIVPITNFVDSFEPKTEYRLSDVSLEVPNEKTVVFTARTHGPVGATALVRAWVSNEPDGTLADAEVEGVCAGDEVVISVILERDSTPELACVRIESERFATKHTVHVELG